jgi:hypothetical protein
MYIFYWHELSKRAITPWDGPPAVIGPRAAACPGEGALRLHPGIRIHSIPVAGTAGLIVVAGMTVVILAAAPALRPVAILCLGGGVLLALLLLTARR